MSPNKWYSQNGDGWDHYTQNDFHTESHVDSSSSHTSGSAGLSLGFFHVGGSASTSTERTSLDVKTDNLSVDFEYTMVDIRRPWLDTTLLNLSNWFLVGDYPAACISDGTYGQQMQVNGKDEMLFLPSIVTSLVLVRNLRIRFDNAQSQSSTFDHAISGGGSIGYGPFHIGGGHAQEEHRADSSYDLNGQGLSVDGVQLIGYVSTITPASPKKASKDYMQTVKSPAPAAQPVEVVGGLPVA